MVVFDDGFGEDAALAEGEEFWTDLLVVPECGPFDWLSVLEQTQARLDEERKRSACANPASTPTWPLR